MNPTESDTINSGMDDSASYGDLACRAEILSRLSTAVQFNVNELVNARSNGPISRLAWLTRNLLELLIWTDYCGKSAEHSRRFYIDSLRDWTDLVRTVASTLTPGPEFDTVIEQLTSSSTEALSCLNLFGPGYSYTRIHDAAEETKRLPFYKAHNKVLSKLAHPTALAIILPISAENQAELRRTLVTTGVAMAREAFDMMEAIMKRDQDAWQCLPPQLEVAHANKSLAPALLLATTTIIELRDAGKISQADTAHILDYLAVAGQCGKAINTVLLSTDEWTMQKARMLDIWTSAGLTEGVLKISGDAALVLQSVAVLINQLTAALEGPGG
jgi:hypothetical protein